MLTDRELILGVTSYLRQSAQGSAPSATSPQFSDLHAGANLGRNFHRPCSFLYLPRIRLRPAERKRQETFHNHVSAHAFRVNRARIEQGLYHLHTYLSRHLCAGIFVRQSSHFGTGPQVRCIPCRKGSAPALTECNTSRLNIAMCQIKMGTMSKECKVDIPYLEAIPVPWKDGAASRRNTDAGRNENTNPIKNVIFPARGGKLLPHGNMAGMHIFTVSSMACGGAIEQHRERVSHHRDSSRSTTGILASALPPIFFSSFFGD